MPPGAAADLFAATPPSGFAVASLGSGSRGNGTLVRGPDGYLLIDCGFTLRGTRERLARLGVTPDQLTAILVTHEHSDHGSGVGPLARAHDLPVFTTDGTARQLALDNCRIESISARHDVMLGGVEVRPVVVPHDARDPVQFVLACGGARLGVLTDAGHVTAHMVDAFRDLDALVLECNHDSDRLWGGRYPESLKRRVGGPHGHLSNLQAAAFLRQAASPRLTELVLAHLSEQNNLPDDALTAVRESLADTVGIAPRVSLATQQQGFGWLSIGPSVAS